MRISLNNVILYAVITACVCVLQCHRVASYKTEVEITPAPDIEATTKKSGFFGGIKSFFRGSPTTTALPPTQLTGDATHHDAGSSSRNKPPPLAIQPAPLQPLGPRPDTPSSPPMGQPQLPPQWPQPQSHPEPHPKAPHNPQSSLQGPGAAHSSSTISTTSTLRPPNTQFSGTPFGAGAFNRPLQEPGNLPPGFINPPPKAGRPLPSGVDLSYGGGPVQPGRPHGGAGHGAGLAPLTSSITTTTTSTTTTTTPRSVAGGTVPAGPSARPHSPPKDEFPPLTPPRRPSSGSKDDFPPLPVPKSPSPVQPQSPTIPSAWNKPMPTPASSTPTPSPAAPGSGRVSFVPHSEQSTSTTVRPGFESAGNSLATDDEIRTLTEALFTKETNSQLDAIKVNPQGKTRSIDSADEAPQPLLEVSERALEAPTIAKMRVLFNNYEQDTLTNEYVTPNEKKEENDFVDSVMSTPVMRHAMLFLQNKGILSPDPKTHRDLVKELWFTQYSRGSGKIGSSGFEHVFVNEVKNGTLIGLHNWVYFFDEEKANRLDYKGYLNQLDLGTKGKIMKVRFTHNGLNKPVNTLFIGTSPELELALYTVCFQVRPDRTCPVSMGNSKFGIVTYSWRYRGKNLIGSAYPEI